MKYTIQKKEFKNKEEIKAYIRKMVEKYPDNTWLNQEDIEFMCHILSWHEEASKKIGCGVCGMWVKFHEKYKTKGFYLTREDGTCTDFSWVKCVDKCGDIQKRDFLKACRYTVEKQILDFKDKCFGNENKIVCPLSNILISKNQCHVDHIAPMTFNCIVKNFIKEYNIDIYNTKLNPTADNDIITRFMYDDIADLFYNYHLEKAQLRVISKEAHILLSKKGGNI